MDGCVKLPLVPSFLLLFVSGLGAGGVSPLRQGRVAVVGKILLCGGSRHPLHVSTHGQEPCVLWRGAFFVGECALCAPFDLSICGWFSSHSSHWGVPSCRGQGDIHGWTSCLHQAGVPESSHHCLYQRACFCFTCSISRFCVLVGMSVERCACAWTLSCVCARSCDSSHYVHVLVGVSIATNISACLWNGVHVFFCVIIFLCMFVYV